MKKIHLSVPEPCHEDWSKMTPVDKGKFCGSCNKTVIDFTGMSDRELIAFFKKPAGNLCGRFNQEQLDRDIAIPRKRIPWAKYFFQFTWPAFILLLKSCGWNDKTVGKLSANTEEDVRNVSNRNPHKLAVLGGLMPEILPVDTATNMSQIENVSLKGDVEIIETAKTNTARLPIIDLRKYMDSTCEASEGPNAETDTAVISQSKMDTVFIISDEAINRKIAGAVCVITKVKTIEETKQNIRPGESAFTVYPNPVSKNSILKMNLRLEKGEYIVLLLNGGGQIVQKEKVLSAYKKQVLSFKLNEVPAGNYFMQLVDTKSGKTFTEKLIVQ